MNKYRAIKTVVDGITFASRRESKRYLELKLLERAGKIEGLCLQRRYPLVVNGDLICTYVSDFVYYENGKIITEDSKGFRTREYIIKRNLMKAIHGIDIREV